MSNYVKLNNLRCVSNLISVLRDVQQGYLVLNNFVPDLWAFFVIAPCIDGCPVPALFYADDLILLPGTQMGLK